MELFSEVHISTPEIGAMVRGLHTVALVDGLEGEVAFLSNLFRKRLIDGASGDAGKTSAAISKALVPLEPSALVPLLPMTEHRKLFLKAAYLLAWADGKVSFGERASIDAFASALGVTIDVLTDLESEIKEHVLEEGRQEFVGKSGDVERRW